MSNRALKKIFGKNDLQDPESEDEVPVNFAQGNTRNPYELLNEISESEAKEDDDQVEAELKDSADSSKIEEDKSTQKKKKKRKKPNRHKKGRIGESQGMSADTEATEDEGALKSRQHKSGKNAEKNKTYATSKPQTTVKFERIMSIDGKLLNTEYELRRIFGAKVIRQERGRHGQKRIYRNNKLIAPKETWPPVSGSGVSMSYLDTRDGFMYFKYDHNSYYRDIQKQFLKAVNTLNPDNIIEIMQYHQYHIDTLIQLSDMAKSAEDMQVAAELIEGALYCLENAAHARFSLCSPLCRLEYKFQENRALFILLFKHLSFVGQRACHRTALELCKRLLSLDPENDPMGCILMIDFYAIKSEECEWLIELYEMWEQERNMSQLPNFSYSVALAYHILHNLKKNSPDGSNYGEKSDNMIQYALMMFPGIILPLLDKCSIQCDKRVSSHSFFGPTSLANIPKGLKLLYDLYVWRTYHVWKRDSVLPWLEKNSKIVLEKVDAKDSTLKDYEAKRKRRYQGTPRNVFRHVLLTDNKELTVNLPKELSQEPLLNFDPLPPLDSIDIYSLKEFQNPVSNSGEPNGVLSLLVRSLFRDLNHDNRNNEQQLDADQAEAVVRGAEGNAVGLQQSLTNLMEAMRDLLNNVHPGSDAEVDAVEGDSEGDT